MLGVLSWVTTEMQFIIVVNKSLYVGLCVGKQE